LGLGGPGEPVAVPKIVKREEWKKGRKLQHLEEKKFKKVKGPNLS